MSRRGLIPRRGGAAGLALVIGLIVGATPAPARADLIKDPAGDFLPTFLGPKGGDLDVIGVEVSVNASSFFLRAKVNAPVGTTAGGFYVWGVNRGAGGQGFPTIAPGVLFDRVVVLNPDGTGNVPGVGPLPPGSVAISGDEIIGTVPRSFLVSTGFPPELFTFNLWPRSAVIPGNPNGNIADFAPDNSNISATVLPEPPAYVLFAALLGAACLWRKCRARATAAA